MTDAFPKTARNKVKRMPERGRYDAATIYPIVDAALIYILAFSVLLFFLIVFFMVYFLVRYRRSRNPVAEELPANWMIETAWVVVPTILVAVFANVFRFDLSHYETYFLSEYLPWIFFAQTTVGSMLSLAWNGQLMKKVRVPKAIFALSTTMANMINLGLSCGPLLVIMLAVGVSRMCHLPTSPVS